MNTGDISTFCFFSFFWTVFMLFYYHNDLTTPRIISLIIAGLLSGLFVTWSLKRMQKNFVKKLLDFDETVFARHVLQKGLMNHFRVWKIIADGGFGFLLEDRLIFVQHKRKQTGKRLTILFSDIAYISDAKFLGVLNTGLKITLKSGKTELFVVEKESDFYKTLVECIANKNIKKW